MPLRVKAFLVHLLVSATVIMALIAYVRWVWYPGGLFWVEGVTDPLSVLFGVDVVLGPLLTLILFVPGKRGLKFDMSMIVLLQVAALVYGAHVLWSARPVAVAFNGNAFDVARAYEMPDKTLPEWAERLYPLGGPAMVFAKPSEDPEFVLKVLTEGHPDVHLLTEQYRPLGDNLATLRKQAYDLTVLIEHEPFLEAWEQRLGSTPDADAPVLVVPLYGRIKDAAVVLDAESGALKAFLDVDITGIKDASPRHKDAAKDAQPPDAQAVSGEQEDSQSVEAPARDTDVP